MPSQQVVEIPDLEYWDYYDINLGDDGVLSGDLTEATPTNILLPFPADAEDPDEEIEVKAIRVLHGDGNNGFAPVHFQLADEHAAAPADIDNMPGGFGYWAFGFFDFDETTEASEAHRDELFEAVWTQPFGSVNQYIYGDETADISTFGANQGQTYGTDVMVIFNKKDPRRGQIFPLNIAFKIMAVIGNYTFNIFLEKEDWWIRIWYRVRKRRGGILARILALQRQTLSG
jgi:hypothetical protein